MDERSTRTDNVAPAHSAMKPGLERVVVVGSSCSGKTTFARRLAAALGTPHIELDALHWLPHWTERPVEDFRALVANAVSSEGWVVDGNYSKARDLIWPKATCIVWLNYGFPTVMTRALFRTFRRSLTGEELYSGNRETFRKALFDKESILLWVLTSFRRRRRGFRQLRKNKTFPHLSWFEFRTPGEAERFLLHGGDTIKKR